MNTFSLFLRATAPMLLLSLSTACAFAAPVQVNPQVLALLQQVQLTSFKMHSFSADISITTHSKEDQSCQIGTVRLMKPNYGYQQLWDMSKDPTSGQWKKSSVRTLVSDGIAEWTVRDNECFQSTDDPHGSSVAANTLGMDFFNVQHSFLSSIQQRENAVNLIEVLDAGTQSISGSSFRVIELRRDTRLEHLPVERQSAPNGVIVETDRLYINGDDVLCRVTMTDNIGDSGEFKLTKVSVNMPLTAADFKFIPAPGMNIIKASDPPPPPQPLLDVGTLAPDFTATAPDGSLVHLSDFKGKTVVLDFWSTWCGPCQSSMPHLEKVYQQVRDKNVAVLGVCVWDKKPEYDKWVTAKKDTYHFPTAFDPAARDSESIATKLYHVSGIPTQYVIDKDGKVAGSAVGYDEGDTHLEDALNKLGAAILIPSASK